MSSGSPTMSDSTMANTRAGAQSCANRPPLTALTRLRSVFISTISAPQRRSWPVRSASASGPQSGFSNSAEPPPDMSRQDQVVVFPQQLHRPVSPRRWRRTNSSQALDIPASRIRSPDIATRVAVFGDHDTVRHRAAQTAGSGLRHLPGCLAQRDQDQPAGRGVNPFSARATASSGSTARIEASIMRAASSRIFIALKPSFPNSAPAGPVLQNQRKSI